MAVTLRLQPQAPWDQQCLGHPGTVLGHPFTVLGHPGQRLEHPKEAKPISLIGLAWVMCLDPSDVIGATWSPEHS
jgi:hypothetical protein